MRHFCMIANVTREGVQEAAQEAQRYLEERGCICRPLSGWSPKGEQRILTKEEVGGDTECILVLGGDGTLIHVCRNLHTRYPVYGWYRNSYEGGNFGLNYTYSQAPANENVVFP